MRENFIFSEETKPDLNLEEEEALFRMTEKDGIPRFRLWVNAPSVILGRNQKPEHFVHLDYCKKAGIPVLKRLSGGGAVYHDEGNLNFSLFLPNRYLALLDVHPLNFPSQFAVFSDIPLQALFRLGIFAERREISSLFVRGRKISGCAMKNSRNAVLFHGTLLISTNLDEMEKTLKIPPGVTYSKHKDFVGTLHHLGYFVHLSEMKNFLFRSAEEFLRRCEEKVKLLCSGMGNM
ncbi:MAG: biotin/lipoate A/B protein ligase family protein [bacterium]